jgi:hypothetical protein
LAELTGFALLALVLQGVVLALDGLITYYWAFTNNGEAVGNAAFPTFLSGTLILTLGLYVCSAVIQDGSKETRLRLKPQMEDKEVRLLWLQQGGVVGDQHFGSCAIFADDGRRDIVLSGREDYFEGAAGPGGGEEERISIRAATISFLTVGSALLTVVGYVVQFIGQKICPERTPSQERGQNLTF